MINYAATFRHVPTDMVRIVPVSDPLVSHARLAWRTSDPSPTVGAVVELSERVMPTLDV
jgi:hypothetical protein